MSCFEFMLFLNGNYEHNPNATYFVSLQTESLNSTNSIAWSYIVQLWSSFNTVYMKKVHKQSHVTYSISFMNNKVLDEAVSFSVIESVPFSLAVSFSCCTLDIMNTSLFFIFLATKPSHDQHCNVL